MNANRKYVAVSIKHTEYRWKFGMPCCLWGFHQTADDFGIVIRFQKAWIWRKH